MLYVTRPIGAIKMSASGCGAAEAAEAFGGLRADLRQRGAHRPAAAPGTRGARRRGALLETPVRYQSRREALRVIVLRRSRFPRARRNDRSARSRIYQTSFGATDPRIVDALVGAVTDLAPDLVAVSGDLTQRARRWQFERAREFLARLPRPQIVVPGNHDVPLYHALARFAWPLRYYPERTSPLICTHTSKDDAIAVMGANTTRSFTIADGGLTASEVTEISARLETLNHDVLKVVVCHHPFELPRTGVRTLDPPASGPRSDRDIDGEGSRRVSHRAPACRLRRRNGSAL